jgi:hypothetical protein
MADLPHDASGPASSEPASIALQQASRPDSPDRGKLRVFISYSREDLEFADQLDPALNACGLTASWTATASPVARTGSDALAT